ncbi:MAG: hypothetical protein IPM97_07410 [Bdellovibrionaceae bacterium]|nr:hypothetical protein [Pseudobdellovibrionaceae bacterium]
MKSLKKSLVFLILVISNSVFAASVTAVKNNKIAINLEGQTASPGTEFFVVNKSSKKVAIVQITQVKGDKAIAEIKKGSAQVGYSLQPRSGGTSSGAATASTDSYYDQKLNSRAHTGNSFGLVGGYLMNSMTATFTGGPLGAPYPVTASMSGSGFGALGFYDYALSPRFILRGMGGVEQFDVAGSISTADCSATSTCNVKLMYLSMYGYGRYNVTEGDYKWWVGGGYGYLYALSKASTVLRAEQISANQIFVFSTGIDIRLSTKSYVPVSIEYGMFPTSDSVKASIIYLRAGYAWNL